MTYNRREKAKTELPTGERLIEKAFPVIIRCKNWEDFKSNAQDANVISFLLREEEKVFQADALKEGVVYTYSGNVPQMNILLKYWLSKELKVDEEKVLEGVLSIG